MVDCFLSGAIAISAFIQPMEMPSVDEVTAVPAQMQSSVDERVRLRINKPYDNLESLSRYMFSGSGLDLEYNSTRTRTIAEVYADREANCLSATLTFMALARKGGLNAVAHSLPDALVWDRRNDTVMRTNHVNVVVRQAGRNYIVDFEPDLITQNHAASRPLTDQQLLAYYYNNLAGEALSDGDYLHAVIAIHQALSLDANLPEVWNNRGVIERRLERMRMAEWAFLRALELDQDNHSALFNLVAVYEEEGNEVAVSYHQDRLQALREEDPYYQFMRGRELEIAGDLEAAYRHYRRAIRLHDGEHEFYYALASVQYRMGQDRRAARSLQRAIGLSEDPDRSIYQAKLDSITR